MGFHMRITGIFITTAVTLTLGLGIAAAQDAGRGAGQGAGRGAGRGGGRGGIPAPLKITVSAFAEGSEIPAKYGCSNGTNANLSPAIEWSGAPAGTMSFALILHDPDVAIGDADVLHWAIFNIPATATGLPESVPAKAMLDDGAVQIKNIGGSIGYFNPCAPPPTTHHYLFELYALDAKLDPAPAERADLMKAMAGHVRAKGIYFGLFHQ
jgi:Raf kinase inhibitor-like YbhB/YbcL family protein